METHDHQSPVDAHPSPDVTGENMTFQGPGTAFVSPESIPQGMSDRSLGEQQAQASPADDAHSAPVEPSTRTAMPEQQGRTVSQSAQTQGAGTASAVPDPATQADAAQAASVDPSAHTAIPGQGQTVSQSAQAAGQQAQFQPNANVIMDQATGQLYYAIPQGQPVQPMPQNGQYVYYTTLAPPEPPPAPRQPDYAQIIKSVEDFAEGDASVADVVKTLWTETSQDDQFWKGAVVGAAAAVLLTRGPVRGAMGKTFGSLFGQNGAGAAETATSAASGPDVDPKTKK
nr:hypothetical protein [uncultured Desulfobacter sp.]